MTHIYATPADINHIRASCFQPASSWTPPTPDEFRSMLAALGYNQSSFARTIAVTDRTIRRWADGQSPVGYSAWCVLCTQAGLPAIWQQKTQIPNEV